MLKKTPVSKSVQTFGTYQDALQRLHDLSAAANSASSDDEHYAWGQYQRLFDQNRQAMAQAQAAAYLQRFGKSAALPLSGPHPAESPKLATVTPLKDSRHIAALGSKENPSVEQRTASRSAMAKRGKNSNAGYFTAQERHALRDYTKSPMEAKNAGHHLAVNSVLEGGKRDYVKETRHADHAGKLINQAISHSKLHKNMVLHRSGRVPLEAKEGHVISTPRLTSTTSNRDVAARFKDKDDPEHATIKIKARKGDNAFHYPNHGLSNHTLEGEVLFGSHQKFHVHSVKTNARTGHRTVTLGTYPKRSKKADEGEMNKSQGTATSYSRHFIERICGETGFRVHKKKQVPK